MGFVDAAEHITGQAFQSDNRLKLPIFILWTLWTRKRDCPGPSCQDLGNRAVPLLADRGTHELSWSCWLCLYRARQGVPIASFAKEFRRQGITAKTMGAMMACLLTTSGGLEDYTCDLTECACRPAWACDWPGCRDSRMIQILKCKTKNNPVLVWRSVMETLLP